MDKGVQSHQSLERYKFKLHYTFQKGQNAKEQEPSVGTDVDKQNSQTWQQESKLKTFSEYLLKLNICVPQYSAIPGIF